MVPLSHINSPKVEYGVACLFCRIPDRLLWSRETTSVCMRTSYLVLRAADRLASFKRKTLGFDISYGLTKMPYVYKWRIIYFNKFSLICWNVTQINIQCLPFMFIQLYICTLYIFKHYFFYHLTINKLKKMCTCCQPVHQCCVSRYCFYGM